MKLTFGSKRADMVREVFYWLTFMLAVGKLSDTTYGMLVAGIVGGYLANRYFTDKAVKNANDKTE